MADLNYTVGVDTTSAQRNLEVLKNKIGDVNTSFGALKAALAGISFGLAFQNLLQYADGIDDLNKATGIATANIIGFSKAVQLNGGDAEKAAAGINKFILSIDEAAQGGAKAQDAFEEVGVTLRDLETLSEQDLLSKTIKGLANISDTSKRAAVANELLGKSMRGVDLLNLASTYEKATQSSEQYAQSITKLADFNQKLEIAVGKVKLAVIQAIEPFVDFFNKMDNDKMEQMIGNIIQLGVHIVALVSALKALELVGKVFVTLATVTALAGSKAKDVAGVFTSLGGILGGKVTGDVNKTTAATGALSGAMDKLKTGGISGAASGLLGFARAATGVIGVLIIVNDLIKLITGQSLVDYFNKSAAGLENFVTKVAPGLAKSMNELGEKMGMAPAPSQQAATEATNKLIEANKKANELLKQEVENRRQVTAKLSEQKKAIEGLTATYRNNTDQQLKNLKIETELLGKSEDFAILQRAQNELTARASSEIEKLLVAKSKLKEDEKALIPIYDKQIAKIQEQYKLDQKRVAQEIDNYNTRRRLIESFNTSLEYAKESEELMARKGEELTNVFKSIVRPIEDSTIAMEKRYQLQLQTRGLLQYDQDTQTQLFELENKRLEAVREIQRSTLLTAEAQQMLTDRVNEGYATQIEMLKKAREEQYQYERAFSTGWTKAFNEYVNNATNSARRAQEQFRAFTSFVDSAIDQMVENGKINFKDLVNSLIKELLKQELKSAIANVAGSIGGMTGGGKGGGNFLETAWNFGKSLLGFANGGMPPVGKPSVVGERGPELFVPKSAGTIIPNHQMGGTTNNTYITNNISAVDAKSVAQLFAENRRVLLGNVKQAEKELPYRV
jgi:lambda family phage tail tape measure protein